MDTIKINKGAFTQEQILARAIELGYQVKKINRVEVDVIDEETGEVTGTRIERTEEPNTESPEVTIANAVLEAVDKVLFSGADKEAKEADEEEMLQREKTRKEEREGIITIE